MSTAPAPHVALNVEIAGVAGSGKSTLAGHLTAHPRNRLDGPLRLRDPRHLRFVAHGTPRLAPLLVAAARARRTPTWTELKLLVYLMEWTRWLSGPGRHEAGATFIDQGPSYALARLRYIEPAVAGTEPSSRWWRSTTAAWADALDAIVWVDAPDDVLLERVNARTQNHEIKGASRAAGAAFIADYRRAYDRVLQALDRPGGPTILRFDTSRRASEDIAADVLDQLAELGPLHQHDTGAARR